MRILAVADTECKSLREHYRPEYMRQIDLVLACGDLDADYLTFLADVVHGPVLYVHGNHDENFHKAPPEGCICIEDRVFEYRGVRILGLGGSKRYRAGPHQYTEREMRHRVRRLWWTLHRRGGFDILLTHAPALGLHDGADLPHSGFDCFNRLLERYRPRYFLHGHVHQRYGGGFVRRDDRGATRIINADGQYLFDYETGAEYRATLW